MTEPQIAVGILSRKNLILLSERKFPGHRKLFIRMGRFIGKGKNIMNYLSLPNKVHMLSLN